MHKIIVIFLPIIIGLVEVVVNKDIEEVFSSMSISEVLILTLVMLTIVSFVSIYSSQKKIKYFFSIFLTSIIGGNFTALVILSLFGLISLPNSPDFINFESFLLQIIQFGALPSIGISMGLLTRPVKNIEENLSD